MHKAAHKQAECYVGYNMHPEYAERGQGAHVHIGIRTVATYIIIISILSFIKRLL